MLRILNAFLYLYHCLSPSSALSFRERLSLCHEEAPIFLLSCPQTNRTYCLLNLLPSILFLFCPFKSGSLWTVSPVRTPLAATALVTRTVIAGRLQLCYSEMWSHRNANSARLALAVYCFQAGTQLLLPPTCSWGIWKKRTDVLVLPCKTTDVCAGEVAQGHGTTNKRCCKLTPDTLLLPACFQMTLASSKC